MYEKLKKFIFLFTVFSGSFLLFLIQPMIAKTILPYVGGSPSAWICSIAFFQLVLLAGYAYSAMGSACLSSKEQSAIQVLLVIICILMVIPLKLMLHNNSEEIAPQLWVITTLLLTIGLPYFILASNSTLIQRWYHNTFNNSPYYLFAISNLGSILGLLSYPFLIEWMFTLQNQMHLWGMFFQVFAIFLFLTSFYVFRSKTKETKQILGKNLSKKEVLKVVILSFIPSSLFLSTTLYISIDFSPFPLMWIIPLTLYLISLTIAFTEKLQKLVLISQLLHPIAFFIMITVVFFIDLTIGPNNFQTTKISLILTGLFVICLSCHGKVALNKPKPQYLTSYYLWLAVGGALGGLLNVIAPYIFDSMSEYYLVAIVSLYAIFFFDKTKKKPYLRHIPFKNVFPIIMIFFTLIATAINLYLENKNNNHTLLFQERNFFGISKIHKNHDTDLIVYRNGNTVHGLQKEKHGERKMAYTYYRPVFNIVNFLPDVFGEKPFGLIGLGGGIFACLGKNGQKLDFFEIDPLVIEIANNPQYFTYIRDCSSNVNIIQGDGRLEIAKQPNNKYSIIVVDAFSSDAIPSHLITKEAIQLYLSKLDENNGVLLIHISSRYLDYRGVMTRIAQELELNTRYIKSISRSKNSSNYSSDWIIFTPNGSKWDRELRGEARRITTENYRSELWTDDYSNIISIMKRYKERN